MKTLWQRWPLVAGVTLVVAGGATAWTAAQPKLYLASATLEYDENLGHVQAQAGAGSTGSELAYLENRELLKTQNYILQSRSLAERVVRRLGLDRPSHDKSQPPAKGPSPFERAVQRVQSSVEIVPVPATRVVTIRVRARSPEEAVLLANGLTDAYLEKSLEDRIGASSRALDWLRAQQTDMKRDVEASELAVYKFREEHQSLSASLDERRKVSSAQLQSYNQALTELRIKRVQAQARVAVLKEALDAEPDPLAVQASAIATDPAVIALRERYRSADAQLQQLAVTLGPEAHQVLSIRAQLEATRAQLVQQLGAILKGAQADLKELERTELGLEQALGQVHKQSLELSREEMEFASLERERAGRSERYSLVLERTAQAELSRALRASTARVLDRAVRNDTPVSPRVGLALVASTLLGLVLGALLALSLPRKVRA